MKKRRRISIFLLAILAVGMLAGCAGDNQNKITILELQEAAMEEEQTVEVVRGDIETAVDLEAWVGPKIEQLAFEKDGTFGCTKTSAGPRAETLQ